MPISVNCPACDSAFQVKDEYAGKRGKCPKCGEPITIPAVADTVLKPSAKAAAPVVARPVVASKPKPAPVPADDEADEPVRPNRKRGADDDRPRAKKRARDDDEDAPKGKRRRRDDDDEPKKKGKALPIILGVVGGVLLLCGGGCAGGWFGFLKPGLDYRREQAEKDRREDSHGKLTPENVARVQAGMTLTQVQDVLGKGYPAETPSVADVLFRHPQRDRVRPAWDARTSARRAYFWTDTFKKVLVAFTADPKAGGTVEGVTYLGSAITPIDTVALPETGGSAPLIDDQPVTLTADRLPERETELKGRTVILDGKVEGVAGGGAGGMITLAIGSGKKQVRATFAAAEWKGEWADKKKMNAGDGVTIKGVVGVDPHGDHVLVKGCELLAHTPETVKPDDRTPVATLTPDELAVNFAAMTGKWVTLKGEFKTMATGEGGTVVLLAPAGKAAAVHPPTGTKFAFKTPPQPLDTLEFTGKVAGSERLMVLSDATLLSQTATAEKPTVVTADDLTAEFDKDADAATKKFDGKLLKVTGPVNAGGNTGARLGLRGVQLKPPGGKTKAYFLDCLFDGDAREAARGVKLGDTATIVGRFAGFTKGTGETYTIKLTSCRVDK